MRTVRPPPRSLPHWRGGRRCDRRGPGAFSGRRQQADSRRSRGRRRPTDPGAGTALPLGEVAAIIVEPVAGNAGVVPPVEGFLPGLRELCDRHGVLLIFDEVITGFRVAPGGAQQLFDVRPDLTVLGKIIGGGLPVGAYGGRAELMDLVAPSGPVYQAGTLSGHPVVMAAGEATLEQLTPDVYAKIDQQSARLEARLQMNGACVARVGSLMTVFFRPQPPRNFSEAKTSDATAFARFFHSMLDAGVLLPPSQFEAWFVSAAHDSPVIDATLEAAGR